MKLENSIYFIFIFFLIVTNCHTYIFTLSGRLLEAKKPHLYWTPYAAHYLDLMLEDIAKLPTIMRTIKRQLSLLGIYIIVLVS